MNYFPVVLEFIVAALLLGSAVASLLGRKSLLGYERPNRLPRYVAAVLTALPGIGMIAATIIPFIAFFASIFAVIVTGGMATASALRGGRPSWAAVALIALSSLGVAVLQPLGLKVMALPKADELLYQPVRSNVIKTYGDDVGFESVRAGLDGTLYLAANQGLDFTSPEYYRKAKGQVLARRPGGSETVLFTTPVGSTAGVMAIAADGAIYMTSNGRHPSIWRISPQGGAQKIATFPTGAWPNGLDFGPDGMLYSADSNLAQIWRVDPKSGKLAIALKDKRLAARRFVALAPGANGLHFAGRDMLVTVSDSTEILKYALRQNGTFAPAKLMARGIPGDDFVIGKDGSLFITTHPYNTLVRLEPSGRRTVVADARQQIVGATDASFGSGPDQDTLYVVTDGGAFTAGAGARGQLIALHPYP